jgi:hypothetical protein
MIQYINGGLGDYEIQYISGGSGDDYDSVKSTVVLVMTDDDSLSHFLLLCFMILILTGISFLLI